jgi:hypothetical protein
VEEVVVEEVVSSVLDVVEVSEEEVEVAEDEEVVDDVVEDSAAAVDEAVPVPVPVLREGNIWRGASAVGVGAKSRAAELRRLRARRQARRSERRGFMAETRRRSEDPR